MFGWKPFIEVSGSVNLKVKDKSSEGLSITLKFYYVKHLTCLGSGALSGKMLLIRIMENNKIYAYLRSG